MQHILILRPGAIGDALLTFPVIQALKEHYQSSHITFVSNAAVLPLAQETGIADEVSDFSSVQWSELFSTAGIHTATMQTLLQSVDRAICWLRDPDGIVEQNLRSSGIKQITLAPGRPPANERIHIVDYLAQTIQLNRETHSPQLHHFSIPRKKHPDDRPGNDPDLAQCTIAIHPGSGGAYKCWPPAHFAAIITALWQQNIAVLLLAGPADHERLADLHLPNPPAPALLKVLVDAPLQQVVQELQYCRGYLGNDAGMTHLAALFATPTIVLFGPTEPACWQPCGSSIKVLYELELARLPVNTVLYTIREFFQLSDESA